MDALPELLTRSQAAELLNVKPETLRRWFAANYGPPAIKVGGCMTRSGRVRYPRRLLEQWAANPAACTTPARPEGLPRFTPPRRREVAT